MFIIASVFRYFQVSGALQQFNLLSTKALFIGNKKSGNGFTS
jgi:hypothetical protein